MKTFLMGVALALVIAAPLAVSGVIQPRPPAGEQARSKVDSTVDFFIYLAGVRADHYWHKGDYESCARMIMLQTELDPHLIELYDQAGWLLWSSGQFEKAEAFYKKGIAHNPEVYLLYYDLGDMYYRTARPSLYNRSPEQSRRLFEQAVEQFRLAVERNAPIVIHRQLAHALHKLGRYDQERQVWENVLRLNPTDGVALRSLERLKKLGK